MSDSFHLGHVGGAAPCVSRQWLLVKGHLTSLLCELIGKASAKVVKIQVIEILLRTHYSRKLDECKMQKKNYPLRELSME